jgi:hypothetical protein
MTINNIFILQNIIKRCTLLPQEKNTVMYLFIQHIAYSLQFQEEVRQKLQMSRPKNGTTCRQTISAR